MEPDRPSFAASSSPSAPFGVKDEDDGKPLPKQTARRRAYAKRSCLKCREKKARCELPDLTIPSSMDAVSPDKACHRCKVLSLDCVVWDGDRKRKPKISAADGATFSTDPAKRKRSRQKSPSARSPGSLEQLAAAAAHLSDQRQGDDPSVTSPLAVASVASSSREPVSTLASVQFFNPAAEEMSTPGSNSSPRLRVDAASRTWNGAVGPSNAQRPSVREPGPSSGGSKRRLTKHMQPPGRTWTSLWRPLSVLIDYAAQQPSFSTYLLSRVNTSLPPNMDVTDLISHKTCLHLKPFIRPYVLWHPHLPALEALYDEHRAKPSASSALLLTSMCLIACRHAMPLTDDLPRKLSALVDQLGTHILLSTPRDLYTVQALELLLAHEPSLVGTQIAGTSQADRGNGLLGESLLAAALTIAKGLDLDKSLDKVAQILATSPPSKSRRRELGAAMAGASIWISLRIWEGHFSFVNSTVRPIDLVAVVEGARALIAIDNNGIKIERRDRDPFILIEHRFPGMDEDSVLRSAGRTGLVYRVMTMARFQSAIADLYRILAVAPKPESPGQVPTTPETRAEILASLALVSKRADGWEYCKMQDFAVFSSVRPALLLEDWATMEAYSLQSLLPCLAICAFTTGELNRGFSAIEMIEFLRHDDSFRKQSSELGTMRDVETHKLLSAFYLYDRGLGYSKPDLLSRMSRQTGPHNTLLIEATGAPLLLTTAFATDGCKTFLEKTACSLAGFSHLPDTANMHLAMMLQTLQRLQECDRNLYTLRPGGGKHPRGRSSPLSPHDHRLKRESSTVDDDDDTGKSISQIGIVFIEDMVQAMSKWKLGVSLHRQEAFHYRTPAVNSVPSSSSTPQSWSATTGNLSVSAPGLDGHNQAQYVAHDTSRADMPPAQAFDPGMRGSTQWDPHSGNAYNYPTQQHPQQHQQGQAHAGTTAQGGMFDIPMFDSLFNPNATMDQWANTVPWFDPVMDGGGFDVSQGEMSLGMGSSMLRPPPMDGVPPPVHRDSHSSHWTSSAPPQHAASPSMRMGPNQLPPLLSVSTPPGPSPQPHGQQYGGPAYPPQNYGGPQAHGGPQSHGGPQTHGGPQSHGGQQTHGGPQSHGAPQNHMQPYYPAQPPQSTSPPSADHHHHHHHFYGHMQRP